MKVVVGENIILYLPNTTIDFENLEQIEDDLRNILKRLKYYYHLDIQGFYEVKVYKNCYYGLILEFKEEDIGYFDYHDGEIDMRLEIMDVDFIYEIRDILELPREIFEKSTIYLHKNKYYLKPKEQLDMSLLLENVVSIHYESEPFLFKEKNKLVG